jgi:tetratricopeptide (TPR) repeat protein
MFSSRHYMAGMQLYQMDRYDQAIREFQQHLLAEPNDGSAYAWLSLCYSHADKFAEGTQSAKQAIALDPENSMAFYALAFVMMQRNRLPEARTAIQEAIRIEPETAGYYGIWAIIEFNDRKFEASLQASAEGLAHDPENATCLNIRAQALTQVGRRAEAAQTIQEALAQNPENSYTHANHGWALLHANQPHEAVKHFSEALRLDPENEYARSGIVEALKARNFIYRGMLAYFLWMGRLPSNTRWGVIMGLTFAPMFLQRIARANPQLAPYTTTLNVFLLVFSVLTWISEPLFNMVLWFDKWGKHALNAEQKQGAFWLSIVLIPALMAWLLSYFLIDFFAGQAFLLAMGLGLLVLPISSLYDCEAGWPRRCMWLLIGVQAFFFTLPLLLMPIVTNVNLFFRVPADELDGFSEFIIRWALLVPRYFLHALIASWLIGMWLESAKVKK